MNVLYFVYNFTNFRNTEKPKSFFMLKREIGLNKIYRLIHRIILFVMKAIIYPH